MSGDKEIAQHNCDAFGPRFRASHRAAVRLALAASIAIALTGCEISEADQRRMMQEEARREYRSCLYDATGPFGSASIEVIKDCRQRIYGEAQGTEAQRAETGTGSVHDGPVRKDAPTPTPDKDSTQ